jgi:hypothetical protein
MRAAVAIAPKILVAAFHMLTKQANCQDLGETFFDHRARSRVTHQFVQRLGSLGHNVSYRPKQRH